MKTKFISLLISINLVFSQLLLVAYSNPYDFSKKAHDCYVAKNYLEAAINYEKAYSATKTQLYKENAVVAYTTHAFNLAQDKKYDKSIQYCKKALLLDSTNKNTTELLCDIYYSKSADYFQKRDFKNAEIHAKESLNYATKSEHKTRVEESLLKISFAKDNKNDVKEVALSGQVTNANDALNMLEDKIYGEIICGKTLIQRVVGLENETFGKTYQKESLLNRVTRLQTTILPNYNVETPNYSNNDYIAEIVAQSRGQVTIFGQMPIKVFIHEYKTTTKNKNYKNALIEAFGSWSSVTNGAIKFAFINDPNQANIVVDWQEEFEDFLYLPTLEIETVEEKNKRAKYKKASKWIRIGSIATMVAGSMIGLPVIGGIGSLGSSVASPLLANKGIKQNETHIMKINTKVTQNMSETDAMNKIKQIGLHQIGHALGIVGHSPNPKDIMHDNFTVNELSTRDINTIKEIYKAK